MKKEKIKRILAFLLAIVFLFSTCLTASPYTVMATGTQPGTEDSQEPSVPETQAKVYTEVVLADGVDLVGNVGLGKISLTLGEKTVGLDKLNSKTEVGTYDESGAYDLTKIESANYEVKASAALGNDGEDKLVKVTVTKLTPKAEVSGNATMKALAEKSYSLNDAWKDAVTEWKLVDNTAKAEITDNKKTVTVQAAKGGTDAKFTLAAYAGDVKLAEKTVAVEKNDTELQIETSKESSWTKPLEITMTLKSGEAAVAKREITYSIKVDGVTTDKNKTIVTDDKGKCEISKHLFKKGQVTVTAGFAGDDAYNASEEAQGTYNPNLQEGELVFTNAGDEIKNNSEKNPLHITYGTSGIELGLKLTSEGKEVDDTIRHYLYPSYDTVINPRIDTANRKITIQPVKVTDTGRIAKMNLQLETADYVCSGTLYIQVDPCVLTVDKIVGVDGNKDKSFDNTKIYDGTSTVDVKASLKAENEQELTDAAKKEIEGFKEVVFENVDCGIKNVSENGTEQTFTFAPSAASLASAIDSKNYTIKSTAEAELTVKKRPLKLVVADTSRAFRSLTYKDDLQSLVKVEDKNDEQHTGFINEADQNKATLPKVVDSTVDSKIKNIKEDDTATWGNHAAALVLDETTGTVSENYVFDFQDYKKGNLNITEETDAEMYVSIDNTNSTHAYEADDGTFYFGDDAVVKFSLLDKGGYNNIYEKENTDVKNVTEKFEGLSADPSDISGEGFERSFYLTREESTENGTEIIQKSAEFTLNFVYDKDAPECTEIKFDTNNKVVTNLTAAITFGIYDTQQLEANVTFGEDLSGIKEWSYYVANIDAKQDDYADDESYEEALTSAEFTAGTENHTIKVGKLQDGQTPEANNYIVFVKVKDNVGNSKIYGSNGVVLENYHDITVSFEEKSDDDLKKWNGRTYVKNALSLNLTAEEEGEKYFTGLKQMKYKISKNGTDSKEETAGNPSGFPKDKTLNELKKFCRFTKTLEFVKDEREGSQVITVSASAEDNAGNGMDNPSEHTFVIDPVVPEISSTCVQENNAGEFLHGKYANSPVTYSVTVKERFLKDLTVYLKTANDTEYKGYTLKDFEENKASLGIASIEKAEDLDITKTTDRSVYHFKIVFDADGVYNVYTVVADAAGNIASDTDKQFVIDKVPPVLEVTYKARYTNADGTFTDKDLDVSKDRAYAGEDAECVIATATVTETNFNAEDMGLTITAVNSKGETVKNIIDAASIQSPSGWEQIGTAGENDDRPVYQLTLPVIQTDANYTFTYEYTDLAGNPIEKKTQRHELTLDREKPTGTVEIANLVNGDASVVWNKLLNAITFGHFGKDKVTVTLTAADETAGVASAEYLTSDKAIDREALSKKTEWTAYKEKLSFAANQKLIVYEKVTDKAGNVEYFSSDGIVLDNTKPVPSVKITPTTPKWGKGVYSAKDKPGFDIEVTDPIVNGARAGQKKITYKIVNQTNGHTETGTLADEKALQRDSHTPSWAGHVNIDPAKFYSNNVQVTVTAEDWSTNSETSKTLTLKVDNKAPVIKFTFDKSDVHNGKYYKNDKKLTITVDERNFDASYMPKVTSSAGGGYKISKWTHHGEIHTATITFKKDSDYTVSYDCYDLAGNKSKTEKLEEFTVDKTAPVIKVAYDNNSALNNSYYKAARTATITVTEHNFDPAKITVNTTASAGGAPKAGGWTNKGDTHTTRVTFDHDADYAFSVSGLDLAENKDNEYGQDKFTVDLTDPEITITGVADKSANNGTVAPVVTIKDTNFISSGAQVTLTGANRGEMNIKDMASTSVSATGMTVNFRDFAKNMDDIYTLTAKSADKAGNETVTTIQFSVNHDGSTYEISEKTKKLLEKVYTSVPEDIELTEINPNELKTIEISYSLDGKVVKLKEGTDYTVSRSGEEGQWKRYSYKINASCFEAEGSYVINIYSEDEANNVTTNKTKAKTMEFTVDKTAPTMVVTNLEDGGHYTEDTHEFTLNVKDNILLAHVELYMDGELVHTYEGDELITANGELHITINGSKHQQTVELVSYDKAGNSSKEVYDPDTNQMMTAQYKVLVTSDKFVQYIHSVPRVIATIVVLAAAIIFIILLIRRRKKEK